MVVFGQLTLELGYEIGKIVIGSLFTNKVGQEVAKRGSQRCESTGEQEPDLDPKHGSSQKV